MGHPVALLLAKWQVARLTCSGREVQCIGDGRLGWSAGKRAIGMKDLRVTVGMALAALLMAAPLFAQSMGQGYGGCDGVAEE